MLKPELARQQLTAIRSAKNTDARLARVKKLPKAAATAGFNLLGRSLDGKQLDYSDRAAAGQRAAAYLDSKPGDRDKILAGLFPGLAADLEACWQLLAHLPYTVGYTRRPFRAPNRPEAYRTRRQEVLSAVFNNLASYPDDTLTPEWIAAWAVHLDDANSLGYLLAAMIDRGGPTAEAVFEIVRDSAASRHDVGGPGRHATRALLCCARPDAWDFTEKLLQAAQRQEGLRQAILEAVDEAHPQAFPRMVRLLLDENLIRFSSVARAAGVWLGEQESALDLRKLKKDLEQIQDLLSDSARREKAIAKGDAVACYRGLWSVAFEDAEAAAKRAIPILKDKHPARRYAAGMLLTQTGLPEVGKSLLPLLDDADPRLVSLALAYYHYPTNFGDEDDFNLAAWPADLFERLEKLIPRLPEEPTDLKPPAPGWFVNRLARESAADLLLHLLGTRPPERLLPFLPMMSDWVRVQAIEKLTEPRTLTGQVREMLLAVAGHPSANLREAALKALKKCKIAEDEAQTLEGYLTRKSPDLRRGVFELLLNRTDQAAVGSVNRLLSAKDSNQRLAALELARRLVEANRQPDSIREIVATYRDNARKLAKPDAEAIEAILNSAEKPASLDDCLGLIDPSTRTKPTPPKNHKVKVATPAAAEFIRELDEYIHEHRDRTFTAVHYNGAIAEIVLGSAGQYHFNPPMHRRVRAPLEFPLRELWETWWSTRSPRTHDADGLEMVRARMTKLGVIREGEQAQAWELDEDSEGKVTKAEQEARKQLNPQPPVNVRYAEVMSGLWPWLFKHHPPARAADFVLDAAETALALVPADLLSHVPDPEDWRDRDWRDEGDFIRWLTLAREMRGELSDSWTKAHDARLYGLLRWVDEPGPEVPRHRPELHDLLAAYDAGAATVADFYDELVGPRSARRWYSRNFTSLQALTDPNQDLPDTVVNHPEMKAAVSRVCERVVEVELARGETPSAATEPAKSISALSGQDTLFRLLRALGKQPFAKVSYSVGDSRPAVLTHLIRSTHPRPDDTPEEFAKQTKAAIAAGEFPEERINELALLNPRWVTHVERTLGWPGYSEAVWWFIAHTQNTWDNSGSNADETDAGKEKKNGWAEIVKARTNLTAEQRAEGVVDVAWFHLAYKAVGKDKRWDAIEEAAKFLGYGAGHKKAARLADVLLGRTRKKELIDGIRQKNLKEYVRLLGLLPLPESPAQREAELLDRHKVLKEYERYARGLSSMSREPAMQAARLGLENLAITAGYPDPLRLEWAVGAKAVADLLKGPVTVQVKNVAVTLSLGDLGIPDLSQTKEGKPIKSIPPEVKKNAKVAELLERRNDLKKSAASTKRSLELAMCQGDHFTADEIRLLMDHALVRPLIERLVIQGEGVRGYPVQGGKGLRDWKGKVEPIKAGERLVVAHPLDLLAAGDWHEWQAECFRSERLQPFKQVFRELYAVTAQERDDGTRSQRYAGQQLNPNQAMALFGSRGWSTKEGVDRLFREAGLVATVQFNHGMTTPGEVEGLTIDCVQFHRRGDWKPVGLTDVPVKVFSEVMRDLDLVVSVAHVGGVDPEASASTVDMRATLVRETSTLLKLPNVRLDSRHALIQGSLGQYSVHLGSGVVHKQPGGALCIVPVHSQHRGRLFLPFADDDPRTAEVVSKVLLLARDNEIQDPTILEQIAGR